MTTTVTCDVCGKTLPPDTDGDRARNSLKVFRGTMLVAGGQGLLHDLCSEVCERAMLVALARTWPRQPSTLAGAERDLAVLEQYAASRRPRIELVPAPGDLCGNTRKLTDGSDCPGCRACS